MLLGLALLPTPALAQYIGNAPPPPLPPALRAGEVETPPAALARAVRTLAQSPRDFNALIAGGRAALDLGDTQAAIGFFGRAEEVRPADPAPKIGMGAAAVATGDASGALQWFYQAQQLGATTVAIGCDRGLAQDLLGNQSAAQVDYRAALGGPEADEARRRLALSLGISGDRTRSFSVLQPLLMRRDPAAQRVRAFVLALLGDERGASNAIDSAMPGTGARMAGFFRLLPRLSAPQKAAAVHLGVFPDPSQIRVAAVSPQSAAPTRSAPPRPVPSQPVRQQAVSQPVAIAAAVPPPAPVVAPPASAAASVVLPSETAAASITTAPAPEPAPAPDRLSGIDRLLAQADELPVPPAPKPRFEQPTKAAARDAAKEKKAAELKKAEARKLAEVKKAAEAKKLAEAKKAAEEKAEREALGVAGTNWVQLAGGAHEDRMATEFRKLAAKSSALRKRGGLVTQGKDYFRLLTGPFASKSEAQAFVNTLAKDGVDGFSWTRTPATIKIEKLPSK
jgi:Flp pilus assembly protein TadD